MSMCKVAIESRTLSRMTSTFELDGMVLMHLPLHIFDDFLHYAIMESKQQRMCSLLS